MKLFHSGSLTRNKTPVESVPGRYHSMQPWSRALFLPVLIVTLVSGVIACSPKTEEPKVAAVISQAQDELETISIKIKDASLVAEVADDTRERFTGLSFRESLAADAGMLFVYEDEKELLFTMRNTSIPLAIAFVSADLEIVEILQMTPFVDGPFASGKPARFALEMNSGWFARHGISKGDVIELERAL